MNNVGLLRISIMHLPVTILPSALAIEKDAGLLIILLVFTKYETAELMANFHEIVLVK